MNKRGFLVWLLPILIILAAVSAFAYMKASEPERVKPQPSEKVWQIDALRVEPQNLSPTLTLYGEVETYSLLRSAAPGASQISQVLVKPGDRIKPGQKLLVMDSRDFAAAHLQAKADVSDIQAQLAEHDLNYQANLRTVKEEKALMKLSQQELRRIQRLKTNNLSSESALSDAREMVGRQELSLIQKQLEVDRYDTTAKQLQARLARARAQLAETELAIERSEVTAPFDGVVSEVQVSVGDRVRISDILLSLYALDSLEIRARIPVTYQVEITRALESGSTLGAKADIAGEPIGLELTRLAGLADPSGIDAYFKVKQGSERLRIGNLVKLELERPTQEGVVALPFSAIYGNNRIFLLLEGRMQAMDVESVGQYEDVKGESWLLVRNPEIKPGDMIITTHLPNAVDGLKVKQVSDS